jgi:hypothetical protein
LLTADGEIQAREMSQWHGAKLADAAISARDGATLRAWIMQPRNSNGNAVILLHGLSDNRLGMMDYADMFLGDGFNILMPDARAHGASGGPPSASLKQTIFTAGSIGSNRTNTHVCSSVSRNPWARRNSCSRCHLSRAFLPLRWNRPFQVSARLPMIASGSFFTLVRGSEELFCDRLSKPHLVTPD